MSNELDRLRETMRAERITPRESAREAAITAALAAFDAQKSRARQGSRRFARLRIAAHAASDIITGKRSMRLNPALAGGASLAVLTLAVLTAANLNPLRTPFSAPEIAAPPPAEPAMQRIRSEEDAGTGQAAGKADRSRLEAEIRPRSATLEDKAAMEALDAGGPAPAVQAFAPPRQVAAAPSPQPRSDAADSRMVSPSFAEPGAGLPMPGETSVAGHQEQGRDSFAPVETNPLKVTAEEPVSTFSIDVDTASYSFTRASLNNGVLPQKDAVRVEELINYFPYDHPGPESREEPFRASVSVAATPWNPATRLVHIGIKGYQVAPAERPKANLVFLLDTSGSMDEPNRLPLLVNSLKLLLDGLTADDTVSIVTYAGSAGTVLEPTKASEKGKIVAALENLYAGGSTAGAEGIRQAYRLARQNFDPAGVNRVILATDGDFNVGITDSEELKSFVERERESGVFLSVLGFGMGNYNDVLMQVLAQNGNGAAAYIDTLNEARKVLVEEAGSTLVPIAKDVKIQVEFNPATVSEYRLIGYETRMLARQDFNNDRVDAGEIGSGHTVTALYEITPAGSPAELVDDLRYAGAPEKEPSARSAEARAGEYGFLKIRYKLPEGSTSRLIETPIAAGSGGTGAISGEAGFAAAVAAFGQILRGGEHTGGFGYDDVIALAGANKGADPFGYRAEFVNLVRLAASAASMPRQQP